MKKYLLIVGIAVFSVLVFFNSSAVFAQDSSSSETTSSSINFCDDSTTGTARNCTLAERITDPNGYVYKSWVITRGIVNIVLILGLLLISFSNISHGFLGINLDSYTIKKALPKLFLGIILANASLFIIRWLADISTVLVYFFVEQSGFGSNFPGFIAAVVEGVGLRSLSAIGVIATNPIVSSILLLIIGLIAIIGILWLAFLLYIRLVAIYLLTILSPLAFMANGIPGLDQYFKKWWQQFIKWLFMLVAMSAIFWLMITVAGPDQQNVSIAQVITLYVLLFFALSLPSKLGGSIINKASEGFQKYTGLNAARKWAGDEASLRGQQLLAKSPIGRLQANGELRRKIIEGSIKTEKAKHAKEARLKKIKHGKDKGKEVLTKAGREERRITELLQSAEGSIERAKDTAIEEFYNNPENAELIKKITIAEFKKNTANKKANKAKAAYLENANNMAQTGEGDKDIIDAIKKLNAAIADEQVIAGELKRGGGILEGNAMNDLYQVPQLLKNYKESVQEIAELEERLKQAQSPEEKNVISESINNIKVRQQDMRHSYNKLAGSGKAKIGDLDFGKDGLNLEIDEAYKIMDKDSELAKNNSSVFRLAEGQQRQALRAFNSGVFGQIKDEIREETIPQLTRQLNEFLGKIGKIDLAEAKKVLGRDITHEELKKAYFEGNNALLSAAGLKDHEVREGRVVAEKFKTIHKSVSDIRHSDGLVAWMDSANTAMENAGEKKLYSDNAVKLAKSTNNGDRKKVASVVTTDGVMSGTPGYVIQRGSGVEPRSQADPFAEPTPPPPPPVRRAGFRGQELYEAELAEYEALYGPIEDGGDGGGRNTRNEEDEDDNQTAEEEPEENEEESGN